jgi:hypothetical protein
VRRDRGDDEDVVTERSLRLELKAFRLEMRLLLVLGLVVTRFQLPDVITVGSVAGAIGLIALKSALAR